VKEGILLRPVQRLFPLEISSQDEVPPVPVEVHRKTKPSELLEEIEQLTTRAGRKIKNPLQYNS
jgi:hypothetical protein